MPGKCPFTFSVAVVAMLIQSVAAAQHADHGSPEKPVTLLTGLGGWKHPIATKSAEAQKYFDQGLALLYGFNRYESLRSFKKAAELDPKSSDGVLGNRGVVGTLRQHGWRSDGSDEGIV